jgi:hypothetical protein
MSEILEINDFKNLEDWDKFVDISPQGSLFCKSKWLEIVCPSYKILTLWKKGRIVAGIPLCGYYTDTGRYVHNMPILTQTLGILFEPMEGKYHSILTKEMEMTQALIDYLPKFRWFYMQFHYNFTNWLPFHWSGYSQSTRYTYVFHDISDLDKIYDCFNNSKRDNIRKSKDYVEIKTGLTAREFRDIQQKALIKDGKELRVSNTGTFETFEKIYNTMGKSWYAIDDKGNVHSAIYVVYDKISAYYLVSCVDRDFRKYGANTLLIWNAIKELSTETRKFDFEGSMIQGVENSFRQFGATQMPYFVITKEERGDNR